MKQYFGSACPSFKNRFIPGIFLYKETCGCSHGPEVDISVEIPKLKKPKSDIYHAKLAQKIQEARQQGTNPAEAEKALDDWPKDPIESIDPSKAIIDGNGIIHFQEGKDPGLKDIIPKDPEYNYITVEREAGTDIAKRKEDGHFYYFDGKKAEIAEGYKIETTNPPDKKKLDDRLKKITDQYPEFLDPSNIIIQKENLFKYEKNLNIVESRLAEEKIYKSNPTVQGLYEAFGNINFRTSKGKTPPAVISYIGNLSQEQFNELESVFTKNTYGAGIRMFSRENFYDILTKKGSEIEPKNPDENYLQNKVLTANNLQYKKDIAGYRADLGKLDLSKLPMSRRLDIFFPKRGDGSNQRLLEKPFHKNGSLASYFLKAGLKPNTGVKIKASPEGKTYTYEFISGSNGLQLKMTQPNNEPAGKQTLQTANIEFSFETSYDESTGPPLPESNTEETKEIYEMNVSRTKAFLKHAATLDFFERTDAIQKLLANDPDKTKLSNCLKCVFENHENLDKDFINDLQTIFTNDLGNGNYEFETYGIKNVNKYLTLMHLVPLEAQFVEINGRLLYRSKSKGSHFVDAETKVRVPITHHHKFTLISNGSKKALNLLKNPDIAKDLASAKDAALSISVQARLLGGDEDDQALLDDFLNGKDVTEKMKKRSDEIIEEYNHTRKSSSLHHDHMHYKEGTSIPIDTVGNTNPEPNKDGTYDVTLYGSDASFCWNPETNMAIIKNKGEGADIKLPLEEQTLAAIKFFSILSSAGNADVIDRVQGGEEDMSSTQLVNKMNDLFPVEGTEYFRSGQVEQMADTLFYLKGKSFFWVLNHLSVQKNGQNEHIVNNDKNASATSRMELNPNAIVNNRVAILNFMANLGDKVFDASKIHDHITQNNGQIIIDSNGKLVTKQLEASV